jgi:hypothetical protein
MDCCQKVNPRGWQDRIALSLPDFTFYRPDMLPSVMGHVPVRSHRGGCPLDFPAPRGAKDNMKIVTVRLPWHQRGCCGRATGIANANMLMTSIKDGNFVFGEESPKAKTRKADQQMNGRRSTGAWQMFFRTGTWLLIIFTRSSQETEFIANCNDIREVCGRNQRRNLHL